MMAPECKLGLLLFHILLNIDANSGFLDIDELNSVNYGIDIINKPICMGQDIPEGAIHLTSKYGQRYQCTYPNRVAEDQKEREEEQAAIETGIPDLLRPMADASCLVRPKDWWTYEFCYGKHIKQYHMEDNKIVGNVVYLGYYESDFDWNNITAKDKKRLYHSQYYVNGSTCDLTNKPRRTEVQFQCEEGQGDYIFEVGEAETCVYTLIVHTPRVCRHPYLKKPTPAKPVPITCKPVITTEQYEEYLENLQAVEEAALLKKTIPSGSSPGGDPSPTGSAKEAASYPDPVAMVSDETKQNLEGHTTEDGQERDGQKNLKEGEKDVVGETGDVGKAEVEGDTQNDRLQKLFMDSLIQGLKNIQEKDSKGNLQDQAVNGVQVKVLKSKAELEKYVDDFTKVSRQKAGAAGVKQSEDGQVMSAETPEDSNLPTVGEKAATSSDKISDDDAKQDKELLDEFEKELKVIAPSTDQRERLADYTENVESAMQAQFSDIVDEAEQELAGDGLDDPVDRKEAFGKLAKTLTQLLKKLQKAEKEMKEVDSHLKEVEDAKILDGSDIESHEGQKDDPADSSQNKDEDTAKLAHTKLHAHKSTSDGTETSPQHETASADGTEASPQHETASADGTEASPQHETASADGTEASPQHETASADGTEASPRHETASADGTEARPQHETAADGTETSFQQQKTAYADSDTEHVREQQDSAPVIDNRVRVRVTRIKHRSPDSSGDDPSHPEPFNTQSSPHIPEEQRQQLETSVKKELQKAGLDGQGQKIQVKIITAGYFDSDSDTVHVLSEEESSAFNNMIVSILGGNNKAAKELARQKQMEETYNHVWGKPTKPTKGHTMAPPS